MGTFKGLIMLPFTLVIYVLAVLVFNLIHAIPTLDYAFAALRFTRRLGVSGARARGTNLTYYEKPYPHVHCCPVTESPCPAESPWPH